MQQHAESVSSILVKLSSVRDAIAFALVLIKIATVGHINVGLALSLNSIYVYIKEDETSTYTRDG